MKTKPAAAVENVFDASCSPEVCKHLREEIERMHQHTLRLIDSIKAWREACAERDVIIAKLQGKIEIMQDERRESRERRSRYGFDFDLN